MPDAISPETGTAEGGALSFDDGVAAIDGLNLDDSGTPNTGEADEAHEAADDSADTPDEGEEEGDAAGADETDEPEDEDGPDEVKGGRFAPDTAKVTLADGTVITVAELMRNNLFQADYTRKTTELATERKELEIHKANIGQIAQSLAQQRDFVLQAAQQFLPQPPSRDMLNPNSQAFDPVGYTAAKAEYDDRMQVLNQLAYQRQAETGRMSEEQKQAASERRTEEAARLVEKAPEFRDRKVYDQFWNDAVQTSAEFGFTADEMAGLDDHRYYLVLRELLKLRKALQRAPQVRQELQKKPQMIQGGKRMDPKAKTSREMQARSDKLRQTGSFDDGVAALMALDL